MSSGSPDPTYANYAYPPSKSLQPSYQQYTQQNQFTTPQDNNNIIAQTPSGTPNPQLTTSQISTSIGQTSLGSQTRRFKAAVHAATITRRYPQIQHSSSIAPPLNEHSPSTLPNTNNVSSLPTPPKVSAVASNFDLRDVIAQFVQQPELLKLILTSKVEEDKRKAAEAILQAKQLDLMLCERRGKCIRCIHDESKNDEIHSNQNMDYENENSIGRCSTSDATTNYASFNPGLPSVQNRSLNSPSSTPVSQCTPRHKSAATRVDPTSKDQDEPTENEQNNIYSTGPPNNPNNCCPPNTCCPPNKKKRKRREMKPVTMIIDAKENPYDDGHLWKNNGNTTQRKTGNKSVYYKCSNSNKGCEVNKTVTEKEGGWTIKYRGNHIEECGKIKRIVQKSLPS